jgi:glycosyltransferase involved in cell wall biosynthesis
LRRSLIRPYLSIIIPAYNEERRLPISLPKILEYLERQPFASEVVVVDDGSVDNTRAVVQSFQGGPIPVRLICNPHAGKGAAVRTGMLQAEGEYLFLCDADLSMPIEQIERFLPPVVTAPIAIGSREAPGARRFNEPGLRHLMGRVFNLIVRLFAVPGFQDTQCGFKCFRRAEAQEIFRRQIMTGFGFDVEVLYLARRLGYQTVEVPIDWYFMANSKVNPLRDTMRMFSDVLRVRLNDWRGLYN